MSLCSMSKEQICEEIKKTLDEANSCGRNYSYSDSGIERLFETCVVAKGTPIMGDMSLYDILSNHPQYNEDKGMVMVQTTFHRFASISDARSAIRYMMNNIHCTKTVFNVLSYLRNDWHWLIDENGNIVTDEVIVDKIKEFYPDIKGLRKGQPLAKVVRKLICADEATYVDFERHFAVLADACKSAEFERVLCLSLNPVDFLRASDGHEWTSCMNIGDPNREGSYADGCTKAGALSYLNDSVTAVAYTLQVPCSDNPEMQPKLMRQLYHFGNGFAAIGRIYPQGNDYTENHDRVYDEWRNKIITIINEALGIDKEWKHYKMDDVPNRDSFFKFGANSKAYHDLACSYCNYSGIAAISNKLPAKPIRIGGSALCPNCGQEISDAERLNCDQCWHPDDDEGDYYTCEHCGREFDYDSEGVEWNGYYYCGDCIVYCNYHDEYEPCTLTFYDDDRGNHYCSDAISESSYLELCSHCGTVIDVDNDDYTTDSDGEFYCSCCEEYNPDIESEEE